jgi:uncharacterized protein
MDNPKVIIKETKKFGKGLIANENIIKDEIIADWTSGEVYCVDKASDLPDKVKNHAIQFEEHKWIDYDGVGRNINHSCEPNCGFKGKFQIVAMRDIKKGEWLTFDYEMCEDSDWKMECECSSKNCRKIIGAYKNMPKDTRQKYKGYISDWLIKKYK